MANVISAVVRLYPINGEIEKDKFMESYTILSQQLWSSYYFFNTIENCIEILYPCKRAISKDLLEDDEINNNYHIWIRVSDYSCYEDLIGFKSSTFKIKLTNVDEKCKYWGGFTDDWNYATSCLYKADELQIKFNSSETNFVNTLVQYDRYHEVNKQITSDLTWSHKMMIVFMKSSQLRFEDDYTKIHTECNFYESELSWNDVSNVSGLIINDNRIRLQEEFLSLLYKYDENTNTIKPDPTIEEVIFKLEGEPVQKFIWRENLPDENFSGWLERTKCDWSNCIDPEFIEFKTWYKKGKR